MPAGSRRGVGTTWVTVDDFVDPKSLLGTMRSLNIYDALDDIAVGHELRVVRDTAKQPSGKFQNDSSAPHARDMVRIGNLINAFRCAGYNTMSADLLRELRSKLKEHTTEIPSRTAVIFFVMEVANYNNLPSEIDKVDQFYELVDLFERKRTIANAEAESGPSSDDDEDLDGTPLFDPLAPIRVHLNETSQQKADRFERLVLAQLETYSLMKDACDCAQKFALTSIDYFNTVPIDADSTSTMICGDLMYGLHVLLTYLSRTNNDNYGDQDDLLKPRKAKMKITLGKIRAIIQASSSLTAALANHLLYHDKNKRRSPKLQTSRASSPQLV